MSLSHPLKENSRSPPLFMRVSPSQAIGAVTSLAFCPAGSECLKLLNTSGLQPRRKTLLMVALAACLSAWSFTSMAAEQHLCEHAVHHTAGILPLQWYVADLHHSVDRLYGSRGELWGLTGENRT